MLSAFIRLSHNYSYSAITGSYNIVQCNSIRNFISNYPRREPRMAPDVCNNWITHFKELINILTTNGGGSLTLKVKLNNGARGVYYDGRLIWGHALREGVNRYHQCTCKVQRCSTSHMQLMHTRGCTALPNLSFHEFILSSHNSCHIKI